MSSRAGRTPRAPVARNLSEKTHQTFTKKFPSRGRKPGRGSIAGTGAPRGQYAHERDAHRTDAKKHAGDAVKRRWGEKQRGNCASGARGGLVKSVPGPSSPLVFFRVWGAGRMRGARSPCADGARCARGTWATWVLVSRGEIELGRPRWRLSRRLARRVLIGNTRDGGRRRRAETTLGEKYAEFGAVNRSRARTDLHTGMQPRSGSGGVEKRGDKRSGV